MSLPKKLFSAKSQFLALILSGLVFSSCESDILEDASQEVSKETSEQSNDPTTYTVEFDHWSETATLENKDAEVLAMESSAQLVAPVALYEKIEEDLLSIRSKFADIATVEASATTGYKMTEMLVGFKADAMALFDSGNYSQWYELNQKYGVLSTTKLNDSTVLMEFERGYNILELAEVYMQAEMDGMIYAEPNYLIGASQDICLQDLEDASRVYIFKQGEDDCPAGCITWNYAGFKVGQVGEVTLLGQFDTGTGALPGQPASADEKPEWYEEHQVCTSFL